MLFVFLLICASCFALCAHADENEPAYGGYYTVSLADGRGVLSVTEDGQPVLTETESEYAVFEVRLHESGGYTLRAAANGGYLCMSYDGGIHTEDDAQMPGTRISLGSFENA